MERTNMFTLLSQQRSGTHFVASLLSSHSGIRVFGEVLHEHSANSYQSFQRDAASGADKAEPPADSWNRFACHLAARDRARRPGVIVMYNQIIQLPIEFFSCLVDSPQVIHLVRRNLLRTHVSDAINRARLKPAHTRVASALSTISLPVQDLARQLTLRGKTIAAFRARLAGCQHVEIAYEDVSLSPQEEMAKVLAFLRLVPEPLQTSFQPSNPQSLSAILTNFSEVRDTLANTEFAWMCSA